MFDFEDDDASRREKCYTTVAQLPAYIDPKQPPTKRSPFSAVLGHPFVHSVDVIMPEEIYSSIKSSLHDRVKNPRYARVFMPLSSLLEGDFFNKYIKIGNILMISEGRPGSDNVFTLCNGILKLELGKEWFERTGLPGKPIRSGGRKHAKERYLVELNLRLPSMLHGKKGFERIVWAFKNVLNQSVAWLFYDLASTEDTLLKIHHPQIIDCEPVLVTHPNTLVPPLQEMNINETALEEELRDHCDALCEWLAMVALASPRVSAEDSVDPYLSRYEVPNVEQAQPSSLVNLKWQALIPSQWIMQLLLLLLRETGSRIATSPAWFALSSTALGKDAVEGKDGYTILALPAASNSRLDAHARDSSGPAEEISKGRRRVVCWEFVGASILS